MLEKRHGSWAMLCDCPNCHMEVIGIDKESVINEGKFLKWTVRDNYHECVDCVNGNCPGAAIAESKYGSSVLMMTVETDLKKGDDVYIQGKRVGKALADAKSGEQIAVDMVEPPSSDKVFDMKYSKDKDEPKIESFDQPHGSTIEGVTANSSAQDEISKITKKMRGKGYTKLADKLEEALSGGLFDIDDSN